MKTNHRRRPRPGPQRGAATLIVVMLLFFLVSLVAAYAARNLLFEQKTSTNQYRATQALEAAEAGLEWALAMLNGGRIDATCSPLVPPDVSQNSFRQRYLAIDIDGNYTPRRWADNVTRERPSCVQAGTGWNCSCPSGAAPAPTVPTGGAVNPAFRVCFEAVNPPQPGVVRVVSTGRTAFVNESCDAPVEGTAGEAAASVSVVVALSSALPSVPRAAVTAVGNVSSSAAMTLVNTDPRYGAFTAHLGGHLTGSVPPVRITAPGTPGTTSSVEGDPTLASQSSDALFKSVFRMPASTYQHQPAATVLSGCTGTCSGDIEQAVRSHPHGIVWFIGNLALSDPLDLGTVDPPAVIVVTGDLTISATTRIRGLLVGLGNVTNSASTTRVVGALVSAGNVTNSGASASIEYDWDVLRQLSLSSGSLVRVPGSWRDFP